MTDLEEVLARASALDGLFAGDRDAGDEELQSLHRALVSLGLQKAFLPKCCGGEGLWITEELRLMERISESDTGLALLVALPYLAMEPLFLRRELGLLSEFSGGLSGDKPVNWALAMTEEQGGAA